MLITEIKKPSGMLNNLNIFYAFEEDDLVFYNQNMQLIYTIRNRDYDLPLLCLSEDYIFLRSNYSRGFSFMKIPTDIPRLPDSLIMNFHWWSISNDHKYLLGSTKDSLVLCNMVEDKITKVSTKAVTGRINFNMQTSYFSKNNDFVFLRFYNSDTTTIGIYKLPSFDKTFDLILQHSPFSPDVGIEFIERNDTSVLIYTDNNYYIFDSKLNLIEKKEIEKINSYFFNFIDIKNKIISGMSEDSSIFNIYNTDKKILKQYKLDFPVNLNMNLVRYDPKTKNLFLPNPSEKYALLKNLETNTVFKFDLLESFARNTLFINDDMLIVGGFNVSSYYNPTSIKRDDMRHRRMYPFTIQIVDLHSKKTITEIIEFEKSINLTKISADKNKFICETYEDGVIVYSMHGTKLVTVPNYGTTDSYHILADTISYIYYFDEKSNRIRFFPLDEKEILHRVNVEKEFGEIGKLSNKEMEKLGISKYLNK